MNDRFISMSAAKFIYHKMTELSDKTISPIDLADQYDLWLADEWTHVGYCIITCIDNMKLVEQFKKGNQKVLEALIGKTIKLANMTVDASLIRELMPLIIARHWR